jgi:Transposase DDE domain
VFRQLVLARIIEPVSKLDSARVMEEAGVPPVPYRTVTRRLRVFARDSWRQQISAACAAHAGLGPASLVLYDVSTLYFETDTGDGFREPGFSKERRLEPQITTGLLTGAGGFPLMVSAFEGNKAETRTMLPVIEAFMAAHQLPDVTVVADAGMVSEANQKAIEAAGLSFILGAAFLTFLTWSRSGGVSTRARRSVTGRCSPSRGRPGRTAAAATRSSTTSTRPTGPAARCAAPASKSPKPSRPSPAKPR